MRHLYILFQRVRIAGELIRFYRIRRQWLLLVLTLGLLPFAVLASLFSTTLATGEKPLSASTLSFESRPVDSEGQASETDQLPLNTA